MNRTNEVPRQYLSNDFKGFMKAYQRILAVGKLLQSKAMKQEQQFNMTKEMLNALEQRRQEMVNVAPDPVNDLPEQGEPR